MFGHFLLCFGGAVATRTDGEGRSPTVLSADALCMRSESSSAADAAAAAARFTHGGARHCNTRTGTIQKHKLMHA